MPNNRLKITRDSFRNLPQTSGVYIFWQKSRPLYIGKAINLKNRLMSYLAVGLSGKTKNMVQQAEKISYIRVESELEALLLEAELVRKYRPRYNFALKDDKHPLYIRISKETFPRVTTARKIEENAPSLAFYGPFTSSRTIYSFLKMLRRIFPFADHKLGKRACIYSHMGLCNPCPNTIKTAEELQKYLHNIRQIRLILSRKTNLVEKNLNQKMHELARSEKFEEAATVREQLRKLSYITQPIIASREFIQNPNLLEDIRKQELSELVKTIKKYLKVPDNLTRIECFDVAHLSGLNPTASMVVFVGGEPEKALYRHFKIHQPKGYNDIASIAEVAKRRLTHLKDWGKPDLVVVDGGRAQVSAFTSILYSIEVQIPVVGIAKRYETLILPSGLYGTKFVQIRPRGPALNLLQRLRDEAHRFARRYHHLLVKKSLTEVS